MREILVKQGNIIEQTVFPIDFIWEAMDIDTDRRRIIHIYEREDNKSLGINILEPYFINNKHYIFHL